MPVRRRSEVDDDYISSLLKEEGVLKKVITALQAAESCNVLGLKKYGIDMKPKDVAEELGLTVKSVKKFQEAVPIVFEKLGVDSEDIMGEAVEEASEGDDNDENGRATNSSTITKMKVIRQESYSSHYEIDEIGAVNDDSYGLFFQAPGYSAAAAFPSLFGASSSEGQSANNSLNLDCMFCFLVPWASGEAEDDGRESLLMKDADEALAIIESTPQLVSTAYLLKKSVTIFESFKCNNMPASLFREKIFETIILIGTPGDGIIDIAAERGVPLHKEHFARLEELLQRSHRFFYRYCTEDYLKATLVGKEPEVFFSSFKANLKKITDDLIKDFGVHESLALTPVGDYEVACDVMASVLETCSSTEKLERTAKSHGLKGEEIEVFKRETLTVRDKIKAIEEEAYSYITNIPQNVLRQPVLYNFWLERFFDFQSVSISSFCKELGNQLREEHGSIGTANIDDRTRTLSKLLVPIFLYPNPTMGSYKLTGDDSGSEDNGQKPEEITTLNIDLIDVRNLFRAVPDYADLLEAVDTVILSLKKKSKMLIPPPPEVLTETIYWESGTAKDELTKALSSEEYGWVCVSGPHNSGKSTRVLTVCHELSDAVDNKDFVWIDLQGVASDMELVSRVVSQLGIRYCTGRTDFSDLFHTFLEGLNPGSVLVFDNVDSGRPGDVHTGFKAFGMCLSELLDAFVDRLTVVLICGDDIPDHDFTFREEIKIEKLPDPVAAKMAKEIFPEDPIALVEAARNLPGEMVYLLKCAHLGVIRKISSALKATHDSISGEIEDAAHLVHEMAAASVALELTNDENICISCFLKNIAHFDPPMAWAFAEAPFDGDKVRWKLAWDSLVQRGWILNNPELGFILLPEASVVAPISVTLVEQEQWDYYINHLADEAIRINSLAAESLSALWYFDAHRRHFSMLFAVFFSADQERGLAAGAATSPRGKKLSRKESFRKQVSDLSIISRKLAGNLEHILTNKFSPTVALSIANCIYRECVKTPADFAYLLAAIEEATQVLRRVEKTAEYVKADMLSTANNIKMALDVHLPKNDGPENKEIVFARAHALVGTLYEAFSSKKSKDAAVEYMKALTKFREAGAQARGHSLLLAVQKRYEEITGEHVDVEESLQLEEINLGADGGGDADAEADSPNSKKNRSARSKPSSKAVTDRLSSKRSANANDASADFAGGGKGKGKAAAGGTGTSGKSSEELVEETKFREAAAMKKANRCCKGCTIM